MYKYTTFVNTRIGYLKTFNIIDIFLESETSYQ